MRLQGALVVPLDVELFTRRAAIASGESAPVLETMEKYTREGLRCGVQGGDALRRQLDKVFLAMRVKH